MSAPYYESSIELELTLDDRETKSVLVNVIVNPHVHEALLSDLVASALRMTFRLKERAVETS